MSRIYSTALALILLSGAYGTAHAQAEAAAPALSFGTGARADGMGRAHVAVADDANAIWWNPGGLAFVRTADASLLHTKLVPDLADDVDFSNVAYVRRLEGLGGGFGFSVGYLRYGESEARDEDGNLLGTFKSYEVVPAVGYGTEVAPNLGIGVSLKMIFVHLADGRFTLDGRTGEGTTFAADLGGMYKVPAWKTTFGAAIQNLGPDIAYIDEDQSDPLPRTFKLGAAYTAYEDEIHRVIVAADANRFLLKDRVLAIDIWNAGAEYEFNRLLALRAGYVSDPIGTIEDFTFGLGIKYRGFRFDFASYPQSEFLDRVQRYSIGYRF